VNITILDSQSKKPIEYGRIYVEKDGKSIHNEPIMEGKAYLNISYGDNVLIRVRAGGIGYITYDFRGILTGSFDPIIYLKRDFNPFRELR